MAATTKLQVALFLFPFFFFHAALAETACENLSLDFCAFSIVSGKRCLLETTETTNGELEYQCRSSEMVVKRVTEYIETDWCIEACGLDRSSIGISADALHVPEFTAKLCSNPCYDNCRNIVDLYFNLAAGEGVLLTDLCEKQHSNPYSAMADLMSSGVALGPISIPSRFLEEEGEAPAPCC